MTDDHQPSDKDAWERNDYSTCRTPHGPLGPKTDPSERLDGETEQHTVAQNTVGCTNFRPQDAPRGKRQKYGNLKQYDDGHEYDRTRGC